MKKISLMVVVIMIVSLLSSMAVNAATTVITNSNFDKSAKGPLTAANKDELQIEILPKTNAISLEEFPSATDKSIKLVKTTNDDVFVQSVISPATGEIITADFKLYIEELTGPMIVMFREPTPTFFSAISIKPDGSITSDAKALAATDTPTKVAEWKAKTWMKIQIQVNPSAKKYSVTIDGKKIVDNKAIEFPNYNTAGHVRLSIDGGEAKGTVYINELRVYTGSETLLDDAYFGDKPYALPTTTAATTAKPAAGATTTAKPAAGAAKTGDASTVVIMLMISAAAVFVIAKRRINAK